MSLIFIQPNREETVTTIVLAIALSSNFIEISNISNDLPIFVIFSSALALGLTLFFTFVSQVGLYLIDYRKGYESIGSLRYAWDSITFQNYRMKIIGYIKLAFAVILLFLPLITHRQTFFHIFQDKIDINYIFSALI